MTADRVAAIAARLAAATAGPWETDTSWVYEDRAGNRHEYRACGDSDCDYWHGTAGPRRVTAPDADHHRVTGPDMRQADADLIAHAPEDQAWLLDRVARLEKVVRNQHVRSCGVCSKYPHYRCGDLESLLA